MTSAERGNKTPSLVTLSTSFSAARFDDHDIDDDNDYKNDSYTAAGAAPGASIVII